MKYNLEKMYGLADTVSIVTGAGGGIGFETAYALGELESTVLLIDLNKESLEEAVRKLSAQKIRAFPFVCDITDKEAVSDLMDQVKKDYGRLDHLINCAGVSHLEPAVSFDEARWDFVMNVNLKGTFLMCQQAGKIMLEQGKGRVVNFSSVRGLQGRSGDMAYSPSKGAVNMLTKSLAIEWAENKISVNAVAPTFTSTNINKNILEDEEKAKWVLGRIPKNRLAELSDIASSVAFLCSPCSEFITGQILYIDGGWTAA
jgi:NAD(P)-dependent dehydrogenase (short-subunit alcohol dehydrogenase family)